MQTFVLLNPSAFFSIVSRAREAAHDFMDYDPNSAAPMGADGCFDPGHRNNAGLDTIWCDDCPLTLLHRRRYQSISRADFWIAAANAVVRRQSAGDGPDLRAAFRWGRRDRDDCRGSGARLPRPAGCREHERVFVDRMGLGWRDVAALMGAHTLGRGSADVSTLPLFCVSFCAVPFLMVVATLGD